MKIAILTQLPSYYTEQRLKEEAQNSGHQVILVQYSQCYIGLLSNEPQVYYEDQPLSDIEVVIPRLTPGSVAYGSAITRQLETSGSYALAGSIAITRSFDRLRYLQLFRRAGIDVPKTIFSREAVEWPGLLEHLIFPLIIRPATPIEGGGPVLVESEKTARAVMGAFSKGTSLIIQEWVGQDGTEINSLVLGSKVIASVKRDVVVGDSKANGWQKIKLSPSENKTMLRAAKSIGLTMCSVQFVRSSRGSYVLAANSAPNLELFESCTKTNLAKKVVEYLELNAKRRNKKDKVGV